MELNYNIILSKFNITLYGDVPKWLKGPHSKCGSTAITVARVQISPSPPIITKGFGFCPKPLFLYQYFIFVFAQCGGDGVGVHLLAFAIDMTVNISRRSHVAVTEPLLNKLHRYSIGKL